MRSDQTEKFVANLDWNLLRTFVVIVEEGSITAAANRLLRRQPTVSIALGRLETQIGSRLIERGGGVFRLTAVGTELYKECHDIYSGVSRLREVANTASKELTGSINISLASHVVTPILDRLLAEYHREFPHVTFQISVGTSDSVTRDVLEKTASLGICLLGKRRSELEYQIMYREFFGFFCGPPHPLFGKEGLRLKDLRGAFAVTFGIDNMGDALRPVALFRQKHKLDHEMIGHSTHLEEVRRMIVCGLGIGPLPIHVVTRDVRNGNLWRLPPYKSPPRVDIHLVTNPAKRFSRAEAKFVQTLQSRLASIPIAERVYTGAT
ncbi:MAG: LysR family transcriptional regulator [Rhodobacteraceae bacterium]|nr:LysR family transcriptional regulator [Paracoccaceae bacterium]